jgi:E3 ubiquitin-protein ligase SHPRH
MTRDLEILHIISKGNPQGGKAMAEWYQTATTLTVSLSRRGGLEAELNYTITGPLQNFWSDLSLSISAVWYEVLAQVCPEGKPERRELTNYEFNDCLFAPKKDEVVPQQVQNEALELQLIPFQRRAVKWMLQREHVEIDPQTGEIVPYHPEICDVPPTFFDVLKDGQWLYVSHVLGIVTKDLEKAKDITANLHGGLLAEEMGLGKTVELLALMCLHRRKFNPGEMVFDPDQKIQVLATGATLIVVPPQLVEQWKKEIKKHAPSLRYYEYKGVKRISLESKAPHDDNPTAGLEKYDIVITTYSVLTSELYFTEPPPQRSRRNAQVYIPKKSPLLLLSWWRVCLDEAQMVDGGYTNAAKVARRIPRVNVWAATGTPLRTDIHDAIGLLLYLKIEPFASNKMAAIRLVTNNPEALKSIFRKIGMRHSKELVHDEIKLPPQNRVVVTIPFTNIEEQNYEALFQQMCSECDVDEFGTPTIEDWNPEDYLDKMRTWLVRLRQTCTHPETGAKNRKALGGKSGPLRTMTEVLESMMNEKVTKYRGLERDLCVLRFDRALMLFEEQKQMEALEVLQSTLVFIQSIVEECRSSVAEEIKNLRATTGAHKGQELDPYDDPENDASAADAKKTRLSTAKARLRMFVDVEHTTYFWIATAYHQLTEDDPSGRREKGTPEQIAEWSQKEEEHYENAKKVRLELMVETRLKAVQLVSQLKKAVDKNDFVEFPDMSRDFGSGGIESQTILDEVDEIAGVLNDMANILDEWREQFIQVFIPRIFRAEWSTDVFF